MNIERDASLRALELTDEEAEESLIINYGDLQDGDLTKYDIVAIKADDMGIPVNRFVISDKILKLLAEKRGWRVG